MTLTLVNISIIASFCVAFAVALFFSGSLDRICLEPRKLLSSKVCPPEFISYEPSPWERQSLDFHKYQEDPSLICSSTELERARISKWLAKTQAKTGGALSADPEVFSRLRFRNSCTKIEYSTWIEPIVRQFRHPLSPRDCYLPNFEQYLPPVRPEYLNGTLLGSLDYLLLLNLSQALDSVQSLTLGQMYSGRKYLFDLGTGLFRTSLKALTNEYGKRGVQFDEIWAWEVTHMEAEDYWGPVPLDLRPAIHFYNIPTTNNASSPENPLNIIRNRVRPGDFVVFKLDIESTKLEYGFYQQIMEDPELINLISEMMWEVHYAPYFGVGQRFKWNDTVSLLHKARESGLRIHYWP